MIRYIGSHQYEIDTEGFKGILSEAAITNIFNEFSSRYKNDTSIFEEFKREEFAEFELNLQTFVDVVEDQSEKQVVNEFVKDFLEEQEYALF